MILRATQIALIFLLTVSCSSIGKNETYKLRKYKVKNLKNGLNILYVQDNSLPYFSLRLLVRTGAANDPVTKSGLGYSVAKLMEKGTKSRSATELADSLGQIGAGFGVSVDDDYSILSTSSLSTHREVLLNDFIEILTQPKFDEAEVKRYKQQTVSAIQKTVDDPSAFASVIYSSYIYGAHPYGRRVVGTIRDIKSIKPKDLVRHYQSYYRPNNSILAVVGDFDGATKNKIEGLFGSWQSQDVQGADYPVFPRIQGVNLKLIDKSDLTQAQIRIGHKAIKRSDPDYLPLRLASIVLGGSFASRLMKKVRVEKGLTYSIGARFGAQKDFGSFTVSTFTRHEKVGETIKETLQVLNEFKQQGIRKEELASAKALSKGLFPRALETAEKFAENLLILRFYGISDDYLRNYYKNINKISVADVNRAVKNHLHPENIKVLVFAPAGKTKKQLQPLGLLEVENYKQFIY